MIWLKLISAPV